MENRSPYDNFQFFGKMVPYINHKSLQLSVSGQFSVLTSMFSLVGGTVTVRGRGLALGTLSEGEAAGGGRGRGRPVMPLGRGWMAAAGREVVAAVAGVVMMYVVDDEPGETAAHRQRRKGSVTTPDTSPERLPHTDRQTDEHSQRDGRTSPGTLPHTHTHTHRQTNEHGQRDAWTSPGTLPHIDRQTSTVRETTGRARGHCRTQTDRQATDTRSEETSENTIF